MKKMIDIVEELVSQGHKVTWRVRTDGGIIVKSIDGQVFHDLTSGNKVARSMVVGGELPMSQITQRQFNVNKYIKLKDDQKKMSGDIDKDLIQKLRRVQRIRRIYGRQEEGKISKKRLRWYIKHEGRQRAMEYLENRERYYKGFAYKDHVDMVVERIERMAKETDIQATKNSVFSLARTIDEHWEQFKYELVHEIIEIVYDHATSVENRVQRIEAILPKSWF